MRFPVELKKVKTFELWYSIKQIWEAEKTSFCMKPDVKYTIH